MTNWKIQKDDVMTLRGSKDLDMFWTDCPVWFGLTLTGPSVSPELRSEEPDIVQSYGSLKMNKKTTTIETPVQGYFCDS